MIRFLSVFILISFLNCSGSSNSITKDQSYTVVVYNIENLFDADGIAVFDDYKPEVYSPRHVFTKITNAVSLLSSYNNGKGPDILILSEIESDHSQINGPNQISASAFLEKYKSTTLIPMLGDDFNE